MLTHKQIYRKAYYQTHKELNSLNCKNFRHKKNKEIGSGGFYRGVVIPTYRTITTYGLSLSAWQKLVDSQIINGVCICPVCEKPLTKAAIDHKHPSKAIWRKMTPEKKAATVRCLAHLYCNKIKIADHTLQTARNVVAILEKHANKGRL